MSVNINTFLNLTSQTINLTSNGSITPTKSLINITSTGGTWYIDNINSASIASGAVLILKASNKFLLDETNNIKLKDQVALIPSGQSINFIYDGSFFIETGRTRDNETLKWGGNSTSGTTHYIDYNSYGSASSASLKHKSVIYRNGILSRLNYHIETQNPTRGTLRLYINGTAQLSYTHTALIAAGSVSNGILSGKIDIDYSVATGDIILIEFDNCDFGHTRVSLILS